MHFDWVQFFQKWISKGLKIRLKAFEIQNWVILLVEIVQNRVMIWSIIETSNMANFMSQFNERSKSTTSTIIGIGKQKEWPFFVSYLVPWKSTAEIGAFQIFFPSLDVTLHREREDYSTTQFVSELGGAAGLFLGVSLISVIKVRRISFPHSKWFL